MDGGDSGVVEGCVVAVNGVSVLLLLARLAAVNLSVHGCDIHLSRSLMSEYASPSNCFMSRFSQGALEGHGPGLALPILTRLLAVDLSVHVAGYLPPAGVGGSAAQV